MTRGRDEGCRGDHLSEGFVARSGGYQTLTNQAVLPCPGRRLSDLKRSWQRNFRCRAAIASQARANFGRGRDPRQPGNVYITSRCLIPAGLCGFVSLKNLESVPQKIHQ